jgi:coiled-coil and C2 domain-containing protein 2A
LLNHRPWFTSEKTLLIEPDPVIYAHYRKASIFFNRDIDIESGTSSEYNELAIVPARIANFSKELEPATLVFELCGLSLHSHPLMLPEHSLVNNIEQMVEVLQKRVRTMVIPFLSAKVLSLEQAYSDLKTSYETLNHVSPSAMSAEVKSASTPKMRLMKGIETKKLRKINETRISLLKLLKEIESTRQLRDTEIQTSRILQYRLVKTWELLKSTRKDQGFISTSMRLTIKARKGEEFDIDREVDKEIFYRKERLEVESSLNNSSISNDLEEDVSDTALLIRRNSKSESNGDIQFPERKLRIEITQKLKLIYDSQPKLEFKIENSLPVSSFLDCPYVITKC